MFNPKDLYIKLVDPLGRSAVIVSYHRVWDEDKFLASLKKAHEERAEGADIRVVSRTTEAEYRKFAGYKNV